MSGDRLEGPRAEQFLAAALAVARDVAASPAWSELAFRGLEAAYGEQPALPAPTLAFDLTALLHGERLRPITVPGGPAVRDAVRAYEDHLLARLTSDVRWPRLTEAVAALPRGLRAAAVGLVTAQLFARLGRLDGTGVSTALVRRLATRPVAEVLEAGRAALHEPETAARLADGLQALARGARRARELLTDAEVFLVENLAALKGLAARVALTQLAEVAQAVDEHLPRRLPGQAREHGEAPTALEEDSAYPVGGFSSLATHGSLENLVTSELIYMEPGNDPALRPDLFDVRFVENELLYYARDEAVAVRRRRAVVLVFDASLARARVLDVGEAYQRLVWLLGSVVALVRKASAWLSTEALTVELAFVTEGAEAPLSEEQGVVALLLREYRERGQVVVRDAPGPHAAVRQAREAHGSRARVLLFAARAPAGLEGPCAPDALVLVGQPRPEVHWREARPAATEVPASAVEAWAAATRALLAGLLGRRAP